MSLTNRTVAKKFVYNADGLYLLQTQIAVIIPDLKVETQDSSQRWKILFTIGK